MPLMTVSFFTPNAFITMTAQTIGIGSLLSIPLYCPHARYVTTMTCMAGGTDILSFQAGTDGTLPGLPGIGQIVIRVPDLEIRFMTLAAQYGPVGSGHSPNGLFPMDRVAGHAFHTAV